MKSKKPIAPVKPYAMEMIFMYRCPACKRDTALLAPTKPAMVTCDVCNTSFPIVPIEEKNISFIKLMLGNGTAAIDADFM